MLVRKISELLERDGDYTPNQVRIYSMLKRLGGEWYMDEIVDAAGDVIDVPRVVRSLVDAGWIIDRIDSQERCYRAVI